MGDFVTSIPDDPSNPVVALWRNNFLPYSETFVYDQLRHHCRYRAVVFCRQRRNARMFPFEPTVALEELPRGGSKAASIWYGAVGRSGRFDRALESSKATIVHAHFGHNGTFALPFAKRHGLPLVVSLHGHDVTMLSSSDRFHPTWWQYALRKRALFDEASLFLAASSELKELIVAAGCSERKVVVHRLGIDLARFSQRRFDDRRDEVPLVLMVGRFVEKKGHEYGLRALAAAKREGLAAKMVIAGEGPLRRRYEQLMTELDLGGDVEFPGPLPHAEIQALLSRAAVLLAPSVVARSGDRESGLIVAKEASATGVPVIGTFHGGIPDIVDDEKTGFLVPERDAGALGARLCELLREPALGVRLGEAARRKMEREYDIVHQIRDLETLYDHVVANHGKTSKSN